MVERGYGVAGQGRGLAKRYGELSLNDETVMALIACMDEVSSNRKATRVCGIRDSVVHGGIRGIDEGKQAFHCPV